MCKLTGQTGLGGSSGPINFDCAVGRMNCSRGGQLAGKLVAVGALIAASLIRPAPPCCAQETLSTAVSTGAVDAAEAARFVEISQDDLLPTLELLYKKLSENYGALHTWSGKYEFEDRQRLTSADDLTDMIIGPVAPPILRKDVGAFTFDVDFGQNKVAVDYKSRLPELSEIETGRDLKLRTVEPQDQRRKSRGGPGSKETDSGKRGIDARGFLQQSIVLKDEYLNFEPMMTYGDFVGSAKPWQAGRAAFRDPLEKAKRQEWGIIPDPRTYFGDGTRFNDEVDRLIKALSFPVGKDFTAEQKSALRSAIRVAKGTAGSEHLVRVSFIPLDSSGKGTNEIVRIFDATVGFNPVLTWQGRTGDKGIPGLRTTYAYQKEKKIYVPARIVRLMTADKRYIKFQRLVTLVDSQVNQPISPDRFTIARFGLKDGERVVDRIDDTIKVVQGGNLVNLSALDKPAVGSRFRVPIVWINLAVVVTLVVWIIVKSFFRSTGGAKPGNSGTA